LPRLLPPFLPFLFDYGSGSFTALRADAQQGTVAANVPVGGLSRRSGFLEDVVTALCHSLIAQSHCAQEAKSPTNGDGFARLVRRQAQPALSRHPARLVRPQSEEPVPADQVGLFLAHVRASTGSATSHVPPVHFRPLVIHTTARSAASTGYAARWKILSPTPSSISAKAPPVRTVLPADDRRRPVKRPARSGVARHQPCHGRLAASSASNRR
jgi:hypothetical protein